MKLYSQPVIDYFESLSAPRSPDQFYGLSEGRFYELLALLKNHTRDLSTSNTATNDTLLPGVDPVVLINQLGRLLDAYKNHEDAFYEANREAVRSWLVMDVLELRNFFTHLFRSLQHAYTERLRARAHKILDRTYDYSQGEGDGKIFSYQEREELLDLLTNASFLRIRKEIQQECGFMFAAQDRANRLDKRLENIRNEIVALLGSSLKDKGVLSDIDRLFAVQ